MDGHYLEGWRTDLWGFFLPSEKLHIAKALLEELKVDRIEVASARVSAGELEGVQRITQWAAQKGS